jgi:hypothetical protein
MGVVQAVIGRVQPGRYGDWLEMTRQAKPAIERLGAKNVRVLEAQMAGEEYGSIVFSTEFDSAQALGAHADRLASDAEVAGILGELRGAKSPFIAHTMSVSSEIDLGRVGEASGSAIWAFVSRPTPGRFEAAVALGSRFFDFMERHGARNCRLWNAGAAGSQTSTLIATLEFENLQAWGNATDALESDPEALSLTPVVQGSDSPITPLSSSVYTEVAL